MGHLVDDLLSFSRLSRQTLETEDVDTGALVQRAIHEVQRAIHEVQRAIHEVQRAIHEVRRKTNDRRVEFIVGTLPPCKGDPALLKQVWLNLLLNAVRYSATREVTLIEVGPCNIRDTQYEALFGAQTVARPEASSAKLPAMDPVVYFVRDNGVGFDMEYAHKLFGVFQRLHRAEDYEGTGVGLAIVQRITHRHDGRVWAKAAVEKGATFYFTLQRGEADDR
jgi:light-regulated signal transduction histidine kinase (bacteriophytochrome)